MRYNPISRPTLTKYMHALTKKVEETIRKLLPNKFALVFDGWSTNDTHYIALFATFPSSNELGYKHVLLSFSPFQDETSQDAASHLEYTEWVLGLYENSIQSSCFRH